MNLAQCPYALIICFPVSCKHFCFAFVEGSKDTFIYCVISSVLKVVCPQVTSLLCMLRSVFKMYNVSVWYG